MQLKKYNNAIFQTQKATQVFICQSMEMTQHI